MIPLLQKLSLKSTYYSVYHVIFFLLLTLVLISFGYTFLNLRGQKLENTLAGAGIAIRDVDRPHSVDILRMVYNQPDLLVASKEDVLVETPWLAPIVWEGTFNINILNKQFLLQNVSIGLTVFATQHDVSFVKPFLETAEKHFMVGHKVNYYIFTDQPDRIPLIQLRRGRKVVILEIQGYSTGEEVSMHRMEIITNFSQQRFLKEVDYLVCADVNMKFCNHVGVEILSFLFGTLHPDFVQFRRENFPYERQPQSQAHIPHDEGDFYYSGAFYGGSVKEVCRLTEACHKAMAVDRVNHIKAQRNEESYLNKYLLYHKPTKVLSPEYMWNRQLLEFPYGEMKKERNEDSQVLQRITRQFGTYNECLQ